MYYGNLYFFFYIISYQNKLSSKLHVVRQSRYKMIMGISVSVRAVPSVYILLFDLFFY